MTEFARQAADNPTMIEADRLSKFYGSFAAVRDVSFRIRRGEVVAFLGPNGAGKSTTMKLLTGYLAPTSGEARLAGFSMATDRLQAAPLLGYLPENGPLYPDMTPRTLLAFFADARGLTGRYRQERLEAVIDICALGAVLGKPISKLSKGYRQRVGMAQALLHEPEVLILDEPTAGLDPIAAASFDALVLYLRETLQLTVVMVTHDLDTLARTCDRVAVLVDGKVIVDTLEGIVANDHPWIRQYFHGARGRVALAQTEPSRGT